MTEQLSFNLPGDYELKPEHKERLIDLFGRMGVTDQALMQEMVDLHVDITEQVMAESVEVITDLSSKLSELANKGE